MLSLRLRLTLWYGTVLAVIFVIFAGVLYTVLSRGLKAQVDRGLHDAAGAAVWAIEQRRFGPFLLFEDLSRDFPELAVLDKFFQIFGPSGKVTIRSPNLSRRDIPLSRTALEASLAGKTTYESARFPEGPPLRLISVPIVHGGVLVNIVQVGTSLEPLEETMHEVLLILLVTVPAGLLVSLAGGWFLAGRALRPVETITQAARRIAAGDLTQRLAGPVSSDEIGRLAATFNEMIARLEQSFRQVRQFSTDASHELRTPLTVLKGETELALRRPRSVEEYRAVLESSLEEIDRMARIVEELLFLSRADQGQITMAMAPVRLEAVLEEIHRQAEVLGQSNEVRVTLEKLEEATVLGDELRLRELLLNLVDNAVKYSHRGGTVGLALVREHATARVTVRDPGIGISEAEQARIFDRFYRTEAARAHHRSGTGLGLAICQWIAEAHGGAIEVHSSPGQGSTFTVMLPVRTS